MIPNAHTLWPCMHSEHRQSLAELAMATGSMHLHESFLHGSSAELVIDKYAVQAIPTVDTKG